jgi:predicted MPP superfamily phosphohydrolase
MKYIELAHKSELDKLSQIHYIKHSCKKEINKFDISIKEENEGVSLLLIDGFMNENETDISEWEESIKRLWKDASYYYLSWESQTLVDLLNPTKISWKDALKNAEITGEILGKVLSNYDKDIILCGHSLGSRVIFYTLKYLHDMGLESSHIKEVHFLGGAIGKKTANWRFIGNLTHTKIFNYYSKNDDVLKNLYEIGTIEGKAIGQNEIEIEGITNINTSSRVDGHSDYKKNLALFYLKHNKNDSKKKITIDIAL